MDSGVADLIKDIGLANPTKLICWNVADPYGGDIEEYRNSARTIKALLLSLGERLAVLRDRAEHSNLDGLR